MCSENGALVLTGHTHSAFTSAPRLLQPHADFDAIASMAKARCIIACALVLFCAATASVSAHARCCCSGQKLSRLANASRIAASHLCHLTG